MKRRSVLIIAHNYPPIGGAGAEPTLRFAEHLPEFGYTPFVLTTARYGSLPGDEEQRVYRAGDLVYSTFARLRPRRARVPQAEQYRVATIAGESLPARLRDAAMIPDTKIGWLPQALAAGTRIIDRYHIDLIFSTSPPETDHLVALLLAASKDLPLVIDLRDGWMFEPPNAAARMRTWRRPVESWLESRAVARAGAITVATDPLGEDLGARYPEASERIVTVCNGYAADAFAGMARRRRPDGSFLLVHTGSLSASRQGTSAAGFFAALAALREADPGTPLRARFVGYAGPEEQALVRSHRLEGWVEFLPPVTLAEAHQHQLDADALLLITAPGQRSVATLKLFDYIGAGVPILALAEDNAAAEIVNRYGLGVTAAPDNPRAILAGLGELAEQQQAGKRWPGFAAAQRDVEWRTLTGQLAALFDELLGI